jgi:hypothetical protein
MNRARQAYCEEDYYGLFAPRCAKCSKSVRDTVVSALNSQWHPECFVCTVCKANFTNQVRHCPWRCTCQPVRGAAAYRL